MRTVTRGFAPRQWRWESSIGLWYGYGPDGQVVAVHRPRMESLWWTLSADNTAEDYVRIYPTAAAAMDAAQALEEAKACSSSVG